MIARALWALRASACAGWMRSLRTQSDWAEPTPPPAELTFFIMNFPIPPPPLLFPPLLPDDETLKLRGTTAVATAAAARLLLSSTGVAGALMLPLPSRRPRAADAAGGASKRFLKSSRPLTELEL